MEDPIFTLGSQPRVSITCANPEGRDIVNLRDATLIECVS
jgi:hypothetical protein